MKVECPHCDKKHEVTLVIGRPRLNYSIINVCDVLRSQKTVRGAAEKLGCSPGYIYKLLGQDGIKPKDLLKTAAKKQRQKVS